MPRRWRDSLGELAATSWVCSCSSASAVLAGDADALDPVWAELSRALGQNPEPDVLAVVWIAYL